MKKLCVLLMVVGLMAGCAGLSGKQTSIDQCIQYRAAFNSTVNSLVTNLATLPQPQQQKYAEMALPAAQAGNLALDLMDTTVAGGGNVPPEAVQQYMAAKNQLIDLIAKIILEKKGVK